MDYQSSALTEQPDEIVQGAWYVAPPIAEIEPRGEGVTGRCVRCNAEVWIGEDERSFADSCGAIACSACTHHGQRDHVHPAAGFGLTAGRRAAPRAATPR